MGSLVDFWVLGVVAWLMFFFFAWLVVWSFCCLLGVLICKWVMQRLWSPPQPQAYTARISPERRSGSDRPVVRPFPPGLRAIPRLTTCVNGTRGMRKPIRSVGFVRTADSDRRPD
jgi:hypothetical protein